MLITSGSKASDALPSLFIPLWNLRAIKWQNELRFNFTIFTIIMYIFTSFAIMYQFILVFQLPYFLFKSILEYWSWNSFLGMSRFCNLIWYNIFLHLFLKTWLFLHGFIFDKMSIFTSVHFINVETASMYLYNYCKDWKDTRNSSLKGSSAQIWILKKC